ncbi:MAG TPA: hypothetical protein VI382_08420, partial [Candidatus Manganitrophaceae bacterium]|nr:hypothetical protein [Candidatus Manganitrophaceae bacterium]
GMGRTLIGLILLATVTSLPELATGVSAVTLAKAPDLAVGDVLGSCVFNLMLIGLIDFFWSPKPILSEAQAGHILSAGFGILLIGLAAWGILFGAHAGEGGDPWIGTITPLIFALYLIAARQVFRFERKRMEEFVRAEAETLRYQEISEQMARRKILFYAGVIVAGGIWLPFIGIRISEATGWGNTFVGNLLIAASTSLPEIVTSFTALRLAAPDLAVANLFGSNLFDMAILAIDDLFYVQGPLLSDVSSNHLISAISAMMMTGIGITGLIYRAEKKVWATVSWDGAALLILYLLNAYFLFTRG